MISTVYGEREQTIFEKTHSTKHFPLTCFPSGKKHGLQKQKTPRVPGTTDTGGVVFLEFKIRSKSKYNGYSCLISTGFHVHVHHHHRRRRVHAGGALH